MTAPLPLPETIIANVTTGHIGHHAEVIHKTINGLRVDVRIFGAACDGVTDDRAAVQDAIDWVSNRGGGEVFLPSWTYIGSSGGTTNLPADDGTLTGHTTITPETVETMPYGLLLPDYVGFTCNSHQQAGLVGPWDGVTIDRTQLVLVAASPTHAREHVLDIGIKNAFIGYYAPGGTTPSRGVYTALFLNCAIPMLTDTLERCYFDVRMSGCWAGIVNGGQWRFRLNGPQEASWADKCLFYRVEWTDPPWQTATTTLLDRLDAIDDFFNAHFFKTANNATRGGPPTTSDFFTANPFLGICGIPACLMSRYGRTSNTTKFGTTFSRGAIRGHILLAHPVNGDTGDAFVENFGWADSEARTKVFGVDRTDPWTASKARGLIVLLPIGLGGISCNVGSVRPEKATALNTIYANNLQGISWGMVKTNEGGGTIDTQQVQGRHRGDVMLLDDILSVITNDSDLGSTANRMHRAFLQRGMSVGTTQTTGDGLSSPGHVGRVYRANHNPGSAWQAYSYVSNVDMDSALVLPSGSHLVQFSLQRGAARRMAGARIVNVGGAASQVTTLGTDATEATGSWAPTVTLTCSGGVLTFALADNFNNIQSGELLIMVSSIGGFF